MSNLFDFLCDLKPDIYGRYHHNIIARDDHYWERNHNFIQWLFPLDEQSRAVQNSPVLNAGDIDLIKDSDKAKNNIKKAVNRYKEFLSRTLAWRSTYNHNHLRITRVIKSLRLLHSAREADNFKYWVEGKLGDQIDKINIETKRFWRLA